VRDRDVVGVLPRYAVTEHLASASLFELKVREPPPDVFVGLTVQRDPREATPLREIIVQIERTLAGLA